MHTISISILLTLFEYAQLIPLETLEILLLDCDIQVIQKTSLKNAMYLTCILQFLVCYLIAISVYKVTLCDTDGKWSLLFHSKYKSLSCVVRQTENFL